MNHTELIDIAERLQVILKLNGFECIINYMGESKENYIRIINDYHFKCGFTLEYGTHITIINVGMIGENTIPIRFLSIYGDNYITNSGDAYEKIIEWINMEDEYL